jgi:hypothetical protein
LKPRLLEAMPRTSTELGRLVTLDRLKAERSLDGTLDVEIEITSHPEGIREDYPSLAKYVSKFVRPVEMNLSTTDYSGTRWLWVKARNLTTTSRFRLSSGQLAPLEGPPRRMPEKLKLNVDWSTKAGPFRVGFRNLRGNVRLVRRRDERELEVSWREPPAWRIPFLFEPLVRGALRHPFEGEGIQYRLRLDAEERNSTRLTSRFYMEVKDTWLMRRFGGSGSKARKLAVQAEREAAEFRAEVLAALHSDVLSLLGEKIGLDRFVRRVIQPTICQSPLTGLEC